MGWRYQYILIGGLSFVLLVTRVFFMKMEESSKWLVTQGRFDDAIETLEGIARINKRDLTISTSDFLPLQPEHVGEVTVSRAVYIRGLFATKTLARSTSGPILLWMCTGIV